MYDVYTKKDRGESRLTYLNLYPLAYFLAKKIKLVFVSFPMKESVS